MTFGKLKPKAKLLTRSKYIYPILHLNFSKPQGNTLTLKAQSHRVPKNTKRGSKNSIYSATMLGACLRQEEARVW